MIWRAGLESFKRGDQPTALQEKLARLEREHLELSRLVHDYETKLHSIARNNQELVQAKRSWSGATTPCSWKTTCSRKRFSGSRANRSTENAEESRRFDSFFF